MRKGTSVERNIDGEWFKAVIQSTDVKTMRYSIKYSDDGNVEEDVSSENLRVSMDSDVSSKNLRVSMDTDGSVSTHHIFSFVKKCTLPKPLAGLVEDDYDTRNLQKPTITIHTDTSTDQAIIINGTADTIAVGGGLRALRYLKN